MGPDREYMTRVATTAREAAEVDVGLRQYMLRVYNYMALGVAFTGIVALAVASNPSIMQAVAIGPFKWVLFLGIIGMGFMAPRLMLGGGVALAHGAYWLYAAAWGALLAPLFYLYTGDSMVRAFFITAGAFAGLSIYGYTTKRNLSAFGTFFVMATWGLLIAILVNAFLIQSEGFHYLLAIVVVLVFAGLTAYETQMIKSSYLEADQADTMTRKAIFGAFLLYGSFVTLFVWLLQLLGVARGE
jgi:hypothetical protein